jgi:hypothetical protein
MATVNRKGIYESNKRPEKLSGGPDMENKLEGEYDDKYKAQRERMVYRDLDVHKRHRGVLNSIAKTAALWER